MARCTRHDREEKNVTVRMLAELQLHALLPLLLLLLPLPLPLPLLLLLMLVLVLLLHTGSSVGVTAFYPGSS